jgi:hypothetical protein
MRGIGMARVALRPDRSTGAVRARALALSAALALAGASCHADERARIDPKTGLIEPVPSCAAVAAAARSHLGAPAPRMVVGHGRLQFFSAPDERCAEPGVFVVPGDSLVVKAELGPFAFAEYTNPRTHAQVAGWVRGERLATLVDEKD